MPPKTVRDFGAPANSYLVGLRRENRGMRIQVQEEQLPLNQVDDRRDSASKPSLVVGNIHVVDAGHGSLSRVVVHLKGKTFRSADEFLNQLKGFDPKVGNPWRILSVESLQPSDGAEQEWNYEPDIDITAAQKLPTVVQPSGTEIVASKPSPRSEPTSEPLVVVNGWIKNLLQSPLFLSRHCALGRTAPNQDDVAMLLADVEAAGGKRTTSALANSMKKNQTRLRGFLAATQRLLNVDGYQALRMDIDSDTVELNRELMLRQFHVATDFEGGSFESDV